MRASIKVLWRIAALILFFLGSVAGEGLCASDISNGPTVLINELMAHNAGSLQDSSGDYDDWIELYNYGTEPVDVAGLYLTDDPTDATKWRIPAAGPGVTTIGPGGFLLIWADDEAEEGPLHANFKLSTSGESVALYDAGGIRLDSVTFEELAADASYGRLPDGTGQWRTFATATPGRSNREGANEIVICEIMYHPYHSPFGAEDTRQEWIELFNKGTEPVNLAGWRLSDGVDYTFPDMVMKPGDYLVVAADVNAFSASHPGVSRIVGGWTKRLSDAGETIELTDTAGAPIDRVEYADEGDWGVRELGPVDHEHRGWIWRNDHDGGGRSLELVHPDLPNEYGQCWAASTVDGGTPGRRNSVHAYDVAPLILDVAHSPAVPRSADMVTVTARIRDEDPGGVQVTLLYRRDGTAGFNALPMFDDGLWGDGRAGDGVYGAAIPRHANGTIVEFYVRAIDAGEHGRTWPAPCLVDGEAGQTANALYLVDDALDEAALWEPGAKPLYYLVMTARDLDELEEIGDRDFTGSIFASEAFSDAQMNATFISIDGAGVAVRYTAGVRNRGNQKRANPPMSYHVNFTSDRPWRGVRALNLNSKYPYCELMGSVLSQMAGLAVADIHVVRLNVNGQEPALGDQGRTYGFYSAIEVLNSEWAENHFPDDKDGNLYRCTYYTDGTFPRTLADLYYKESPGEIPDANDYRDNYPKKTNESANDYSDLFRLIDTLNNRDIPDANYLAAVSEVIDVEQWMRFLAVDAFLGNREGGLPTGIGDDFAMYRGVHDPRFRLVPHDMDTLLGQGDQSYQPGRDIFPYANVTGLRRLLRDPDVLRIYYRQFRDLAETVFAPENLDPVIDEFLADWVPETRINGPQGIKQFFRDRARSIVYGGYPGAGSAPQIPQMLTISGPAPMGGYAYTRAPLTSLEGTVNAMEARSVAVNGQLVPAADWSQRDGTWSITGVPLYPGINRVTVQAFDGPAGTGREVERGNIDIWYDNGAMASLSGTLPVSRTLEAGAGPWQVTGDIVIPAGVTLTLEAGVTLFFDGGTGITVQPGGRLVAEGEAYRRIRLTLMPAWPVHWSGIHFDHSQEDNRLCYVDLEFGDGQGESIDIQSSRVLMEHVTWGGTNAMVLNVDHPTAVVRDCIFPSIDGTEPIHGVGLTGSESLIFERCVFGTATGYNDIIDFTGARRPGPVLQIYDSFFLGGGDDGPDLDGTDAHLEGNVFMGFHSNQGGDGTSNAIATGQSSGNSAEAWVVRNFFIDNDHAILLKEDCFLRAENNTFIDTGIAVVSFGEPDRNPPRPPGKGAYMAGNIFWNNAAMFEHYFQDPRPNYGPLQLRIDNSILATPWHSLGQADLDADPLFEGQSDLRLKSMSPARETGLWGLDMGANVPAGAAVIGEPPVVTHRTDALLTVGGPGITHYRYSLNDPNGPWSAERPVDEPLHLTALPNGSACTVYVLGENSAGRWQEQPNASRTWVVDTAYQRLIINEVLATGRTTDGQASAFPDAVELYYDGPSALELSGMTLSDDPEQPAKFVFPAGTRMQPGTYLVLTAEADAAASELHLGFGLDAKGDGLYLYNRAGELVDEIEFGRQLPDLSIGRCGWDEHWCLTIPTLGQANRAVPVGDPARVRINEWLAQGQVLFDRDFIELCNPQVAPVDVGGCYLTDNPVTQPGKHRIRPLSFIAGGGFAVFEADDGVQANSFGFRLATAGEMIGLFDPDLREIDKVFYVPQVPDVSQGRFPDGAGAFAFFMLPTPGLPNPEVPQVTTDTVVLVAEGAPKRAIIPTAADQVPENWKSSPGFDDSGWLSAAGPPGGVGFERSTGYEHMITLDVQEQMYGRNATCYVRIPFEVEAAQVGTFAELYLSVRYDDGFVAYLNGVEVARINVDGTPKWDSTADGSHEARYPAFDEILNLSNRLDLLRGGTNLLAIHALNTSTTSSDLLISAALEAKVVEISDGQDTYREQVKLLEGLRVTELMYHAPQGDEGDYIELRNIGSGPLDLTGLRFTAGVDFDFPAMTLAAGESVVVVNDLTAFRATYGTEARVAGQYDGRLSDSGEQIVLKLAAPLEAAIMRFHYEDTWYPTTDGGGESLVVVEPAAAAATWDTPDNWRPSEPAPGRP